MAFILDVYRIERAALDADALGTPEHLEMWKTQSKAVMDAFKDWQPGENTRHMPRGPMGEAMSYALGNLNALTLFLTDPHLPQRQGSPFRARPFISVAACCDIRPVAAAASPVARPRVCVPSTLSANRGLSELESERAALCAHGARRSD